MRGSPADAISHAIERSKGLLFPVNGNKWFALGFTAFLAQCGESGSSLQIPSFPTGSGGSGTTSGSSDFAAEFQTLLKTLTDNLALTLILSTSALLLLLGLGVLYLWISSRAKLMFVESVIWDRLDVGAQWTRASELGQSLLKFRLILGISGTAVLLVAVGSGLGVGFQEFAAGHFLSARALVAYAVLASVWLLLGLPLVLISAILDDFVVPLMVLRNLRVRDAWSMCRMEVLANNAGGLVVFYLLRLVVVFVVSIVSGVLVCVTCCVAALPYLGTVVLLPVHVFSRAYPLYYLEQLGIPVFPLPEPDWAAQERWRFPQ